MFTRTREPEIMDDPALDFQEHRKALNGLSRLNAVSGSAWALWRPIRRLAKTMGRTNLSVLDLATGGADNVLRLWELGQRAGVELCIDGCDISQQALLVANATARHADAPSRFFQLNVLEEEIPQSYDVIMTSLFTHHLSEQEVVVLLQKMKASAAHMVIVNDLVRSQANLILVSLASNLLSCSPVVKFDGQASVKAAFTVAELKALADKAGLHSARLMCHFPCRMTLVWTCES